MTDRAPFSHGFVNAQTIETLFNAIKEKIFHGQPPEKIPELNKLWQKAFNSGDAIIANSCIQALLNLVKSGDIKIEDAIDSVVNLAASIKNVKWLVHFAVKLLILQFNQTMKSLENSNRLSWKCSYKLHCHTHPFIFILNSSPQSWNYIVNELQALLLNCCPHRDTTVKSWNSNFTIDIFKPFFLYVLLNPSVDNTALLHKSSLLSALTKHMTVETSSFHEHDTLPGTSSIQFFSDVLYHLKVKEFNLQLHNEILRWVHLSSNVLKDLIDVQFISTLSLSILSSLYSLNHSPSSGSLACILHQILQIVPDVESVGVLAIGLSNLICHASPEVLEYLLQCVIDILRFSGWLCYPKPIRLACLLCLKAAVLQLLLHKHYLAFCELASFLNSALSEIDKMCTSFINQPKKAKRKIECEEFHDCWLSDIAMLFKSFETCQLLNGSSYILNLKSTENMALNISLLTCGVVIFSTLTNGTTVQDYVQHLKILLGIASSFPQLTLTVLPTILFAIKKEEDVTKRKHLCLILPDFAVDNICMPFVLGAIEAMGHVSSLRSFAINLMVTLWRKQERCFPYLQKMLSQTMVMTPKIKIEVITVTAIALRELCQSQSAKYSSELLAMVSSMLKKHLNPAQASILLEGTYALLDKEVVNIQSMWSELMQTQLLYNCDSVTKALLKIFSLVPKFEVDLPEYVLFKSNVLSWIWTLIEDSTTNIIVKGAALVCLAHFKREDFILKHLPFSMRPSLPQDVAEEEFLLQPIPGQLLVDLMISVPSLTQVQYFCCSLLSQELQDMPRDIKDRAFRAQKQAIRGNVFSDFSNFILHMHERNKQPNLKGHFATSVLMCYNPSFDDSAKNLVSSGRNALHLLQALLCEVIVDAKNWKGLLWIVHGWKHFMQLCLQIMIKGRITELNLQLKQKDCDEDDVKHKLNTAEFWCRDKITDLLKSSSKGTPSMQGNSLLALAGLICALKFIMIRSQEGKEENDKPDKEEGSGYLSHNHWMGMATDTIITSTDSKYKSVGRIFSWCQYKAVSRTGRLTTSKFGEVCALQALKILVPALMPHDMDRVFSVLSLLANRVISLSQKEDSGQNETPMTVLHLNLTLGGITADLFQGKVHETSNQALKEKIDLVVSTLMSSVWNCLSSKSDNSSDDEYSSDEDTNNMVGSLLGIALILPALFSSGKSSLKVEAVKIFNSLVQYIDELEDKSGGFLEAFYFAFIAACIAGKATRSITLDVIRNILTRLEKEFSENRNIPISVALSHLCYDLSADDEKKALNLYQKLYEKFLKDASNEKLPTRQKLTSLNGLVALTGSESVFAGSVSELTQETENNIRKVTKLLKQYAQHGKDIGITSNSILLLGRLYLSLHTSNARQTSSLPQSYSYLPETSLLRPVYQAILNFSKSDSISVQSAKSFMISLSEAAAHSAKPLPPVDLLPPLSRLPQFELNEKELTACIELALTQVLENETAAVFLDTCMESSKFQSFHFSCQCFLLRSLHVLTQHLSSVNCMSFLSLLQNQFFTKNHPMFHQSLLQGVLSSLKLSSLPQDVPAFLFAFAVKIIKQYKFSLSDVNLLEHWKLIAFIAVQDPSNKILLSFSGEEFCIKILFMKSHLVCEGIHPIQWINDNIKVCARSKKIEIQRESLWIIFLCLRKRLLTSKSTAMLMWLQELMAILKKVNVDNTRNLYWLKVFAVCVLALANRGFRKVLKKGNLSLDLGFGPDYDQQNMFLWNNCLYLLPQMLTILLSQQNITESFSQQVMELLLHLHTHAFKESRVLKNCLLQVFHSPPTLKAFQSTSVWTTVASSLFL